MWAAQHRWLRAIAMQHHLDPDATLPEDILLLAADEKGRLFASVEYESAVKRCQYEERHANPG
jgi:hypothetical protein